MKYIAKIITSSKKYKVFSVKDLTNFTSCDILYGYLVSIG